MTDLIIGLNDNWEAVCQRLPQGWRPDFLVLYLPYTTIARWLWSVPIPIIGLAADWNLLWHAYRHILPRCDLVLTDPAGVERLSRLGLDQARPATLFGCERGFVEMPKPEGSRDIDILFVGNLHPAVQRQRLAWLGRVAALSERWNVVIHNGVFGAAYRDLMSRARIVFNRGIRGEANKRAFEAAAAGALLFQEQGNIETPAYFEDGRDCVYYNSENLEQRLTHYLDHEEERRAIADAGSQRARRYGFADFWETHLELIEREWDGIVQRSQARPKIAPESELMGRTWQALSAADGLDASLALDLAGGLVMEPRSGSLHNALGLATAVAARGGGPITSQVAEQAAGYFRGSLKAEAAHVIAGLNLAEALVALDRSTEAIEQANRTLATLNEGSPLNPAVWDSGHFPPAFDHFRVEWERAGWQHAGDAAGEEQAKRALLRWRLHFLLGDLTSEAHHYYEAALVRPDLPPSQAALGCALSRAGKPGAAIPHLRQALEANPFDCDTARELFKALGNAGDGIAQRRLARDRRQVHQAAGHVLPPDPAYDRVPPVGDELATILILCHNQVSYTRLCLESVLRHTRPAYELVIVDNASTDGTAAYLADIRGLAGSPGGPDRVVVLHNETNRGFAAGCNQALAAARGRYLVFLNNDTIVTEHWLDGLVAWALHDWPMVGLVGPVSNEAAPPQRIGINYRALDGIAPFAQRHRLDNLGKLMPVDRLTGFCLLVRREVLEQIGTLDESFGIGFFEDDDLCVRARQAGFKLILAGDVFIHHFGNRTFRALGVNVERMLRDNFELFKAKWGAEHAAGYRLPPEKPAEVSAVASSDPERAMHPIHDLPTADSTDEPDVVVHPGGVTRPCTAVSMIVRNEEANLGPCLDPLVDLFDEIVIADTGSTDGTKDLAKRFGAKVIDFPWVDSFAAARNASLESVTADWVFWPDADDRLDRDNRQKLKALLADLGSEMAGYRMKCLCPPDPERNSPTMVDHLRLFPKRPGVCWEFRVHEQILPSLKRLGAEIRWTNIVIHHVGYLDLALRNRKRERDFRLLQLEEKDNPNHPYVLFNLAIAHQDMGNFEEALRYVHRSLEGCERGVSIERKLYAISAGCQRRLGRLEEALIACQAGRRVYPEDVELLFQEGLTRRLMGDLDGAAACFEHALVSRDGAHFGSVAVGLQGFMARQQLAQIYAEQGRLAEAEAQQRAALAEQKAMMGGIRGI